MIVALFVVVISLVFSQLRCSIRLEILVLLGRPDAHLAAWFRIVCAFLVWFGVVPPPHTYQVS